MSFFVWRRDHEDVKRQLAEVTADRDRLLGLFLKALGVQMPESVQTSQPGEAAPAQAAPTVTELTPEEELELENQREIAVLTSVRRTNPAKLAPLMQKYMAKKISRAVAAAHPQHKPNKAVADIFEQAKKEVS